MHRKGWVPWLHACRAFLACPVLPGKRNQKRIRLSIMAHKLEHPTPTSSGDPAMAATKWTTSPSSVTPSCRKTRVISVEEKERDEEEDGGLK